MNLPLKISNIQKLLSIKVYRALDYITASEYMRRLWMESGLLRELLSSIHDNAFENAVTQYIMGSCYEGTTTPGLGSDLDVLYCHEKMEVVQDLNEISPDTSKCWLAIQEERTKPGYVKLLYIPGRFPIKDGTVGKLVCDFLQRDSENRVFACRRKLWDVDICVDEINGPADTTIKRIGCFASDHVQAYMCSKWPLSASSWQSRKRKYNWPSDDLIREIVSLGFFLVPIGHPHSPERHLEWRISLSLQERFLMQSLNTTQYKVYILMKLIKKDILSHFIDGKTLTSYHLKTCLFYMIEGSRHTLWVPDNLLICLRKCLKTLVQWVGKGFCPNYFIPEENMFDGRLSRKQRAELQDILLKLVAADFYYLIQIKCDNFQKYLIKSRLGCTTICGPEGYVGKHVIMVCHTVLNTLLKCKMNMLNCCVRKSPDECILALMCFSNKLKKIKKIHGHTMEQVQKVVHILVCELELSIMSNIIVHLLLTTNHTAAVINSLVSEKWNNVQAAGGCFTSQLKQATFLHILGYFDASLKVLCSFLTVEDRVAVCRCREGRLYDNMFYADILGPMLEKENMTEEEFRKERCAPCIVFLPTEKQLLPKALIYEMNRSFGVSAEIKSVDSRFWYEWALVDSKILMDFLKYLNHEKLNSEMNVLNDLLSIGWDLIEDPNLGHKETDLNLFGWALATEGFLDLAVEVFGISLLLKRFNNAAALHLLMAVNEIYKRNSNTSDSDPNGNKSNPKNCTVQSAPYLLRYTVDNLKKCFLGYLSQVSPGYIISEE